ncbi:MAG: RNB domain-containing ribonuclease, partial [Oxalobacteraceae bacterium]
AYGDFQSNMERYWCLRWLAQQNNRQVEAVVLKDEVFRLVDIPLVIRLAGTPPMTRGAQVRLDLIGWDEVELTVEARLLEVISTPGADAAAPDEEDALSDTEAETDVASGEQAAAIATELDTELETEPEPGQNPLAQ